LLLKNREIKGLSARYSAVSASCSGRAESHHRVLESDRETRGELMDKEEELVSEDGK